MKEEDLSQINEGRTAQITLQWMEPIFQKMEARYISSLKSCFRQGKHTELVLACHVSNLCSIEDLREELKGIMRRGQSVAQESDINLDEVGHRASPPTKEEDPYEHGERIN